MDQLSYMPQLCNNAVTLTFTPCHPDHTDDTLMFSEDYNLQIEIYAGYTSK